MNVRLFLVDVEATGPSPANSVMTEFGVVEYETRQWFHGKIWDATPLPENPALSVATERNPRYTTTKSGQWKSPPKSQGTHEKFVFEALRFWLGSFGGNRSVFVSDNPGFDFQWMSYGFDSVGMNNPFGHSSRRIGDFAAGLAGDWREQSKWKKLRVTRHDHNPVHDAKGNAEALAELLKKAGV